MSRECVAAGINLSVYDPDGEIPDHVQAVAGPHLEEVKVIAAKFRRAMDDPYFVLEWLVELLGQRKQDPTSYEAYEDLIHVLAVWWNAFEAGQQGAGPEVLAALIEEAASRFVPGVTVTVSPVTTPDAEPMPRC